MICACPSARCAPTPEAHGSVRTRQGSQKLGRLRNAQVLDACPSRAVHRQLRPCGSFHHDACELLRLAAGAAPSHQRVRLEPERARDRLVALSGCMRGPRERHRLGTELFRNASAAVASTSSFKRSDSTRSSISSTHPSSLRDSNPSRRATASTYEEPTEVGRNEANVRGFPCVVVRLRPPLSRSGSS